MRIQLYPTGNPHYSHRMLSHTDLCSWIRKVLPHSLCTKITFLTLRVTACFCSQLSCSDDTLPYSSQYWHAILDWIPAITHLLCTFQPAHATDNFRLHCDPPSSLTAVTHPQIGLSWWATMMEWCRNNLSLIHQVYYSRYQALFRGKTLFLTHCQRI